MTEYSNAGSSKTMGTKTTHRIIVSENGIRVEPIGKPQTLQQYPSNTFRE